jgi:hypothetical protein
MTQFATPIHVIPTCIDGCDGRHLASPEYGPGECHAYTAIGATGMDCTSDREAARVGLVRSAHPQDGVSSYVHLTHNEGGVTYDACLTPDQALALAAVHASWFTASA